MVERNPSSWQPESKTDQIAKRYQCPSCHCSYGRKEHLNRHQKNIHGADAGPFMCSFCKRTYKNAESLRSHMYQSHNPARGTGVIGVSGGGTAPS
jgi:uncharacterized Zn-finger protein